MPDKKLTQVADPTSAIASYLDELLHTATDTARQEAPESRPERVARERARIAPRPALAVVRSIPETRVETPVSVAPVVEKTPEIAEPAAETGTAADIPSPPASEPPGRPEWSDTPFECLIFTVAGLQLAVPLILLGAIHRIDEPVKPIPGSPRWYMGMRPERDHNLRVVDTAEWIMAGRAPANARDNYRFVIRLDSSEWGLACDDVAQSFTLKPDEVRWRTARSKRPWLAGTVIDHMCALVDVRTMAELLVRAEREHHLDLS
ncbi:chemotaxis protein CheW [Marinobacter orientalis]|uniref:Chemotaxis protein CheW n=1 Tax=Marinobacter orientalis TaxID=1928859 RepID=A0A7Y0REE6_9GAMM|nr:CheW domain-containing protein [Marinobacter orientalis]NMT64698.1 chemotaxis protein CheW [Marinobacter orientalis]TGX48267.1 chemotaxis protein CheW [Marinobacter orientalis]